MRTGFWYLAEITGAGGEGEACVERNAPIRAVLLATWLRRLTPMINKKNKFLVLIESIISLGSTASDEPTVTCSMPAPGNRPKPEKSDQQIAGNSTPVDQWAGAHLLNLVILLYTQIAFSLTANHSFY